MMFHSTSLTGKIGPFKIERKEFFKRIQLFFEYCRAKQDHDATEPSEDGCHETGGGIHACQHAISKSSLDELQTTQVQGQARNRKWQ